MGEVVVGEHEVDLLRVVEFEFGGPEECDPGVFRALFVEVFAVDEFVKDEVAVGV